MYKWNGNSYSMLLCLKIFSINFFKLNKILFIFNMVSQKIKGICSLIGAMLTLFV